MATCQYWPYCVGGGQYCWDRCADPAPTESYYRSEEFMSATRDPETDQPLPKPGEIPIHQYLLDRLGEWNLYGPVRDAIDEGLRERRALGIRKYKLPLQTHNGRDASLDAWQEALDLLVYVQQMQLEEGGWEHILYMVMIIIENITWRRIQGGAKLWNLTRTGLTVQPSTPASKPTTPWIRRLASCPSRPCRLPVR